MKIGVQALGKYIFHFRLIFQYKYLFGCDILMLIFIQILSISFVASNVNVDKLFL